MSLTKFYKRLWNGHDVSCYQDIDDERFSIVIQPLESGFKLYTFVFEGCDVTDDACYTKEVISFHKDVFTLKDELNERFPDLVLESMLR